MHFKLASLNLILVSKVIVKTSSLVLILFIITLAEEKALVEEVFNNAIEVLSDEDKKLPQVQQILPLLKRGVGIHHSGLLPLIKETIEILFGEGLIKTLFATETFAMGLNMPARTVVFTNARKFDGTDFRWLTSGEYIQMSGRAGRRGLDERGIVILMIDEKMSPAVGKELVRGKPDPINSAFHLTYNMVLNLLRVEEVNPEYMLEHSFFQFQHYLEYPKLNESKWLCQSFIHFTYSSSFLQSTMSSRKNSRKLTLMMKRTFPITLKLKISYYDLKRSFKLFSPILDTFWDFSTLADF